MYTLSTVPVGSKKDTNVNCFLLVAPCYIKDIDSKVRKKDMYMLLYIYFFTMIIMTIANFSFHLIMIDRLVSDLYI